MATEEIVIGSGRLCRRGFALGLGGCACERMSWRRAGLSRPNSDGRAPLSALPCSANQQPGEPAESVGTDPDRQRAPASTAESCQLSQLRGVVPESIRRESSSSTLLRVGRACWNGASNGGCAELKRSIGNAEARSRT